MPAIVVMHDDRSGGDREQAALQGAGQAGGPDDAHQAAGGERQGGQARGLVRNVPRRLLRRSYSFVSCIHAAGLILDTYCICMYVYVLYAMNLLTDDTVQRRCRWDKKPLKNRDTVGLPLVGRLAEASRRGAMLLTHALMGFGKDPKPAQPPPPPSQSSQH